MKLAVQTRSAGKKGEIHQIRRDGNIPAIVYSKTQTGIPITVKGDAMQAILRNLKAGRLATTIFELEWNGKNIQTIIKDIQYHVATYQIQHIDFVLCDKDQPVTVHVPIVLEGVADCAGVKLGGFIRQVIRNFKISCLPKDIPQEFSVNVMDLNINQSKRLADIVIPPNVKPLVKLNEVAVVVAKKAG